MHLLPCSLPCTDPERMLRKEGSEEKIIFFRFRPFSFRFSLLSWCLRLPGISDSLRLCSAVFCLPFVNTSHFFSLFLVPALYHKQSSGPESEFSVIRRQFIVDVP